MAATFARDNMTDFKLPPRITIGDKIKVASLNHVPFRLFNDKRNEIEIEGIFEDGSVIICLEANCVNTSKIPEIIPVYLWPVSRIYSSDTGLDLSY